MKILLKIASAITLILALHSCAPTSNPPQLLNDKETRKTIIDSIANNSEMMREMMTAMMNSPKGKMMFQGNREMDRVMMENQSGMMTTIRNNPGMIQNMMSHMIKMSHGDSIMTTYMCKTMMEDPAMMQCMLRIMRENEGGHKMGSSLE